MNLLKPKPEHTTGRSGRFARPGGGAGVSRTGCQQNCLPRKKGNLLLSKAKTKRRLNFLPEARRGKIPCKPNAGPKSMVDEQFI